MVIKHGSGIDKMKNYGNYPSKRRNLRDRNLTPNYEAQNEAMRQLYAKDERLAETCQTPVNKCLGYPHTKSITDDAV
jgi:hypothetical protein